MKKVILVIIFSFFIFIVFGLEVHALVIYDTLVDQTHGFYKVYERNDSTMKLFSENNTIHISVGDTVSWSNDAFPDIRLTIMSNPDLWNNSGDLVMNNKRFSYKFNESGTYIIYIKQFPTLNQTIIVGEPNQSINESNQLMTNETPKVSETNISIESNQQIINATNNNKEEQDVLNNTSVLVKNDSINSMIKTSSISTNNIILLMVFLSMVILGRKLEYKYCEKRK